MKTSTGVVSSTIAVAVAIALFAGCGGGNSHPQSLKERIHEQMQNLSPAARHRINAQARRKTRRVVRRARRQAAKPKPKPKPATTTTAPPSTTTTQQPTTTEANCTPGYSPCLPPASDYDCSGGDGDGPEYTGQVRVTGSDPYGLDDNGNGVGCEPY
jgi:hypothetical protein